MKESKRSKVLEVVCIAALLICLFSQQAYAPANMLLEGSGIQLEIGNGGSIGFGDSENGVVVAVTAGTLNGSTSFMYWRERGEVRVQSENAAAFTIDSYGEALPRFGGGQSAEKVNKTRILGTTLNGDNLLFGWGVELKPLLPFMFILGIVGLFSFFGGLLWAAYKIKEGDYVDGLRKGVVFCSIGFGLIWGWLSL